MAYRSIKKNTIGINVSPIIWKKDGLFESVICFLKLLLRTTDDSILLVPHVYEHGKIDSKIIQDISSRFIHEDRVIPITEELNCEQLKYYISQCKAFIGCRTHSTIAAYSSNVPTLVLGYSVKSKGIATDLFGQYEGYVLMYDSISSGEELFRIFMDRIYVKTEAISGQLKQTVPEYKEKTKQVIKKIIGCDLNESSK